MIAILAVVCGAVINTLVTQSRAAQASWFVQAQLDSLRYERRDVLRQALGELEALHASLELARKQTDLPLREQSAFRALWRRRLHETRATYQLDGQPRFARANMRAEEALRDAVLYLTSLERQMGDATPEGISRSIEKALLRSFKDARLDLD